MERPPERQVRAVSGRDRDPQQPLPIHGDLIGVDVDLRVGLGEHLLHEPLDFDSADVQADQAAVVAHTDEHRAAPDRRHGGDGLDDGSAVREARLEFEVGALANDRPISGRRSRSAASA